MGVDFLPEMVEIAKRKGVKQTLVADAMKLPFPPGSFDCVTIAFGLRNLPELSAALREMRRILSDNGHLLVLEFSLPRSLLLRGVYRIYLHRCLPLFGSLITRQKSAYHYLGDSIEEFPSGTTMTRLMKANGFISATVEPLTGGIVTIYTAAC
jgi:demethylmenaquinone methyltransferase/2-methoxy-6-polyprenyl-1,4-benzoquinol methylase